MTDEKHLKPGQLEEKRREGICCKISRSIFYFTLLTFLTNIVIFIIDIAIKKNTLPEYLSTTRPCFIETLTILANTYFITSDIFIHKMMLSGAKLKDYTNGLYHITVTIQLIFRIIFYATVFPQLSTCTDYLTGNIYQLGINALQFILTIFSVYTPLFLVFLNLEPTKCFACCIYRRPIEANPPV